MCMCGSWEGLREGRHRATGNNCPGLSEIYCNFVFGGKKTSSSSCWAEGLWPPCRGSLCWQLRRAAFLHRWELLPQVTCRPRWCQRQGPDVPPDQVWVLASRPVHSTCHITLTYTHAHTHRQHSHHHSLHITKSYFFFSLLFSSTPPITQRKLQCLLVNPIYTWFYLLDKWYGFFPVSSMWSSAPSYAHFLSASSHPCG